MSDYANLKATELKDILKSRGILHPGLARKQQFIEALEAHDEQGGGLDTEVPTAAAVATDAEVVEDSGDGNETTMDVDGKAGEQTQAPDGVKETASAAGAIHNSDSASANPSARAQVNADEGVADEGIADGDVADEGVADEAIDSNLVASNETSPVADVDSDSRKRKRRSPTPPISEDSINKRLKAADEVAEMDVKFPEDVAVSEDIVDGDDTGDRSGALHPTTHSLYICELVRPLHADQLREHLEEVAAPSGSGHEKLVTFHIDTFRTHAFVVFASMSAASRARSALHAKIWPDEPSRKPLWVDFVPDDKVLTWIDTETDGTENRRTARRWEVLYAVSGSEVSVTHQEVSQQTQQHAQKLNNHGANNSSPNDRRSSQVGNLRPSSSSNPADGNNQAQSESQDPAPASFNQLDQRFKFTNTKPKLYYLPVNKDLAARRLEALKSITSREWDEKTGYAPGTGGQLRRYTYDDGDVLVDGGPDLGDFGRFNSARGRGGGGGGGGGGRWNRGPRGRR